MLRSLVGSEMCIRDRVFVARDVGSSRGYSEVTARKIDEEIKKLIDDAYAKAKSMLLEYNDALINLSKALLEYETLDARQVEEIIEHGEMKDPPTPPNNTTIPGNQADEGVAKKPVVDSPSSDDDPLAGEAVGAPA